jgi:serine/threonine protein kinase
MGNDSIAIVLLLVGLLIISVTAVVVFRRRRVQRASKSRANVAPVARSRFDSTVSIRAPKLGVAASLTALSGPLTGTHIDLKTARFTLGRKPDSTVVIDDDLVSRQHALIERRGSEYILYDRSSTNGCYVNGKPIYQYTLKAGDQIQIGPVILVFNLPGLIQNIPAQPISLEPVAPLPPQAYDLIDYDLVQPPLGKGSAALVYRGYARPDRTPVAIKILSSRDRYFRDQFKMALELAQTLQHPHITRIYGGGQCRQGNWYIAVEYNEGGSLRDRLTIGQGLPLPEIVRSMGQTCEALAYAHRRGIYHRDLKPENVMFSKVDEVKLGDFGVARIVAHKTITARGMLVGTPEYMSVEQIRGQDTDERSDLYSMGIVLYEMLTGRRPFEAADPLAVLDQQLHVLPPPPSQFNRFLPDGLDAIALRALAKDPAARFQSAEELARALSYTGPFSTGENALPATENAPLGGARLVVFQSGKAIPLTTEAEVVLGREKINPNSSDNLISRQHARIWCQNGYWLEDLNSANGTFVNGVRIWQGEPVLLRPGSVIVMGNTQINFEI